MRVLLALDFDGCLHPHMRHEADFCRSPLLWAILRACPNTKVILTTSWRRAGYSQDELVQLVTQGGGEDLAHRFIGATPCLEKEGRYGRRDLEILSWCNTNGYEGRWLALDDIPEVFNGNPNLYVVDGSTGLTDADVKAIITRIGQ